MVSSNRWIKNLNRTVFLFFLINYSLGLFGEEKKGHNLINIEIRESLEKKFKKNMPKAFNEYEKKRNDKFLILLCEADEEKNENYSLKEKEYISKVIEEISLTKKEVSTFINLGSKFSIEFKEINLFQILGNIYSRNGDEKTLVMIIDSILKVKREPMKRICIFYFLMKLGHKRAKKWENAKKKFLKILNNLEIKEIDLEKLDEFEDIYYDEKETSTCKILTDGVLVGLPINKTHYKKIFEKSKPKIQMYIKDQISKDYKVEFKNNLDFLKWIDKFILKNENLKPT